MEEFPRYRKRSTRRPSKKSNHKHIYKYCVFREQFRTPLGFRDEFVIGTYCSICGKIGGRGDLEEDGWIFNDAHPPFIHHEWSDKAKKEFDPDTRTLPFFEITDLLNQKFVEV